MMSNACSVTPIVCSRTCRMSSATGSTGTHLRSAIQCPGRCFRARIAYRLTGDSLAERYVECWQGNCPRRRQSVGNPSPSVSPPPSPAIPPAPPPRHHRSRAKPLQQQKSKTSAGSPAGSLLSRAWGVWARLQPETNTAKKKERMKESKRKKEPKSETQKRRPLTTPRTPPASACSPSASPARRGATTASRPRP